MAYNPPACFSDNIHSDPLCRKTIHSIHPGDAAGFFPGQGYRGRHGHTTHYVIVNEHEPSKKLLRSATRIPRHYFIEDSAEILELYPRNIKCYTPRTAYYQQRPHWPKPSQQHLNDEGPEVEKGKGRRRVSLGKAHRPRSLSDLHQPPHFYIGDHLDKNLSTAKDSHIPQRKYAQGDEKDDDDGESDWVDFEPQSQFQMSLKGGEPVLVRTRHPIHSPGRRYQSPGRKRHLESCVKPKIIPKPEATLTESDSASLASSSDQQNSSTDQYIQVIHNKERYLKSNGQQAKIAKKRSKNSFEPKIPESNDLVFSNVWHLFYIMCCIKMFPKISSGIGYCMLLWLMPCINGHITYYIIIRLKSLHL